MHCPCCCTEPRATIPAGVIVLAVAAYEVNRHSAGIADVLFAVLAIMLLIAAGGVVFLVRQLRKPHPVRVPAPALIRGTLRGFQATATGRAASALPAGAGAPRRLQQSVRGVRVPPAVPAPLRVDAGYRLTPRAQGTERPGRDDSQRPAGPRTPTRQVTPASRNEPTP